METFDIYVVFYNDGSFLEDEMIFFRSLKEAKNYIRNHPNYKPDRGVFNDEGYDYNDIYFNIQGRNFYVDETKDARVIRAKRETKAQIEMMPPRNYLPRGGVETRRAFREFETMINDVEITPEEREEKERMIRFRKKSPQRKVKKRISRSISPKRSVRRRNQFRSSSPRRK